MKIIAKHLPYSLLIRRETVALIVLMFFLFSCGNEKALLLPEISHSEISEIQDVSHAYLFYDETQKDSVELNRKNLISTTNWLINVDKRLNKLFRILNIYKIKKITQVIKTKKPKTILLVMI